MSTLIQELLLLSEANTSVLKQSDAYERILVADQSLAKGLEMAWGYKEFFDFVTKAIDSGTIGKNKFNITPKVKDDLRALASLHEKTFPNLKPSSKGDIWDSQYIRRTR